MTWLRARLTPIVPQLRVAGRWWWRYLTDRGARGRLRRVGWQLVPAIAGAAMLAGSPAYLRIRVVNPRAINFADGLETLSAVYAAGATGPFYLMHSLGTEAGTDNSITYWTTLAGVPTFASHQMTVPSGGDVIKGHDDTTDCTIWAQFTFATGLTFELCGHHPDANNNIQAGCTGTQLFLAKLVASVNTSVSTAVISLTNGTKYWMQLICQGTTYTAAIYNDSSNHIGTQIASAAGTISDAGVQTGPMGIKAGGASAVVGSANPFVCFMTGPQPDGYFPVVVAGEPDFCNSKTAPPAGTFSGSIQIRGSSSGSGAWQRNLTGILAGNNTLSAQIKASAGNANVSAGGVTTPNGSAAFAAQSSTGAMTANPQLSLNYSGGIGKAYFDSLSIAIDPTVAQITDNLPHPNQATWTVATFQPGNPATTGLGSWTIPLYSPTDPNWAAAYPIYSKIQYYMRVEAYIGAQQQGITLGQMRFAGVITGIRLGRGGQNALSGSSDLQLAALSPLFPGELVPNVLTSAALKGYMGLMEWGAMDSFNPYTAANYLSTHFPPYGAGAWSSTTQDGLPVVSCTTGTGAALLSQIGAAAQDAWHTVYIEATGTLIASADAANAGKIGIGMSGSPTDCNTSIVGYVIAKKNASTGRWDLDAKMEVFANGSVFAGPFSATGVATSVDEPTGTPGSIPVTIGLLMSLAGTFGFTTQATLIVNGQAVLSQETTGLDPANLSNWPFLFFGTPASGAATGYLTNLVQLFRYTDDQHPADAWFVAGNVTTTSNGAQVGNTPGSNLLDMMVQMATREGFFLRYTPKPWVAGVRTLGTIDFATDPGTDQTSRCIFSFPAGNCDGLQLTPNADPQSAGTTGVSAPSANTAVGATVPNSGGLAPARDIPTIRKFGPLFDKTLGVTAYGFPSLRRIARQALANKTQTGLSGAKTAVFLRDQNADVWRECDRVTVDDPVMGVNKQSMRVMSYDFTEGQATQPVVLDQFSADSATNPVQSQRNSQALFQIASLFNHR